VQACAQEIQSNYADVEDGLLAVYTDNPEYKGKPELAAILRWHFLQPLPQDSAPLPGETNLCRQREYVEYKMNYEIRITREANQNMPIRELFTTIESAPLCFLNGLTVTLQLDQRVLPDENYKLITAPLVMNDIARIIYYQEFKDALIRNSEK
jgi:hypothetical protein